jgi:hypothetical protein
MVALALLEMWEMYEYCMEILRFCNEDVSMYDGQIREWVKAIGKARHRAIFERSIGLQK